MKSNKREKLPKEFKSFKKDNSFIFKTDLYTQLFNINNDSKLDEWAIEFIIFSQLTSEYKGSNILDYDLGETKDVVEILKQLYSGETKDIFKEFWPFLSEYLKYRESGVKDSDREYSIIQKYWKWTEWMRTSNIESFNTWIIQVNSAIYTPQKGLKLK